MNYLTQITILPREIKNSSILFSIEQKDLLKSIFMDQSGCSQSLRLFFNTHVTCKILIPRLFIFNIQFSDRFFDDFHAETGLVFPGRVYWQILRKVWLNLDFQYTYKINKSERFTSNCANNNNALISSVGCSSTPLLSSLRAC